MNLAAGACLFVAMPAMAQIAVSAHDGKQLRPDDVIDTMTPDEVAIIDLGVYPPRQLAVIDAPASMIGPPGAVAVAPDESFALVTAAQKLSSGNPAELVPATTVSLIDLSDPSSPRVIQAADAGPGASGVAINPAGTLALVASTEDDTVTVFNVGRDRIEQVGKLQFPEGAGPCDVAFLPDGQSALVARRGDSMISLLEVDGTAVSQAGVDITPGRSPYQIAISPDGRFAYTNNLGGAATRAELDAPPPQDAPRRPGTVSAIDLHSHRLVTSVEVGATPETVVLSPDGTKMAVVVANGASVQRNAPNFDQVHGLLRIFEVDGGTLNQVAELPNGHWCQGATFSDDGSTLLVQCGSERNIEVYRLAGGTVSRDESATISTRSRGGSMATASVR